jgi:hypothetical protein
MNVKLYKECVKLPLPYKEKTVLRSLASFASRDCNEAYPSVATLASDTGLGKTTVRECLRNLEKEQVAVPQGNTKGGGRGCATVYFIIPENYKPNTRVVPLSELKPPLLEPKPTTRPCETHHTSDDDGCIKVKADGCKATTTEFSEEHMAECIQMVSDYYLEATGRERIISPSEKQLATARLVDVLPRVNEGHLNPRSLAGYLACAIDMAHHIVKTQPQKKYFSQWYAIFGKQKTFASLIDQHADLGNVPAAAQFPETEQEIQERVAAEKAEQERKAAERERNAAQKAEIDKVWRQYEERAKEREKSRRDDELDLPWG